MPEAEFDKYVIGYRSTHAESIKISGDEPEYFMEYKVKEFQQQSKIASPNFSNILDFGCGIGNSIPYLKKYFPKSNYFMADVSAESLGFIQSEYKMSDNLIHINANAIPVADAFFDACFTACVFHHIPHDEHVHWLAEIRRAVKPKGKILLFEHNPLNPLTRYVVRNSLIDINAKLIYASTMRDRLLRAGWKNVDIQYHIFFPKFLSRFRQLESRLNWLPIGAQYACIAEA